VLKLARSATDADDVRRGGGGGLPTVEAAAVVDGKERQHNARVEVHLQSAWNFIMRACHLVMKFF
jgi:hypothetical protein